MVCCRQKSLTSCTKKVEERGRGRGLTSGSSVSHERLCRRPADQIPSPPNIYRLTEQRKIPVLIPTLSKPRSANSTTLLTTSTSNRDLRPRPRPHPRPRPRLRLEHAAALPRATDTVYEAWIPPCAIAIIWISKRGNPHCCRRLHHRLPLSSIPFRPPVTR